METFKLNEIIISTLNHWANSSLYISNLVIFCAVYLGWVMLVFLIVYIYRAHRRWWTGRFILIALASALVALLAADLIKHFYPLARPASSLKGVIQIFTPADKASFPSMHMAFFGGLAFALMWHKRQLGLWFLIGAVVIGLARVVSGVHYPLDIIAGGLLGFIISLFFRRWLKVR